MRGDLDVTSLSILPHPSSSGPGSDLASLTGCGRQVEAHCLTIRKVFYAPLSSPEPWICFPCGVVRTAWEHTQGTQILSVIPFSKPGQVPSSAAVSSASKGFVPRQALPHGMCMVNACLGAAGPHLLCLTPLAKGGSSASLRAQTQVYLL